MMRYEPDERWMIFDETLGNLGKAVQSIGHAASASTSDSSSECFEDVESLLSGVRDAIQTHIETLRQIDKASTDNSGASNAACGVLMEMTRDIGAGLALFGALGNRSTAESKINVLLAVCEMFALAQAGARKAATMIRETGEPPGSSMCKAARGGRGG